ncbi:MAG: glycerol-3-phosphate dehydrogenase/oxidase [Candidatus Omnitrophica bacterium]|nr:glycerol-3-phosphate dehydrogenase/oxidase [Candidatus Omnitrophota bacterium]
MIRDISRLTKSKFDLIVVGGGINGAAIANLAAACGATVALLEKGDFAQGTSSKSTKLLHGGIRYLENFEFDLVHESLRERFIQWQSVPYLVKPLPFVIPVYKNDTRPLWMMKLGVWLYDLLSGKYRMGQHRFLQVSEISALAPGINLDGLIGGVGYTDAQMDDARLCLENVLMAYNRGAVTVNYLEVENFIKDNNQRTIGVKVRNSLSGQQMDVFGSKLIVTAGPWADELIQKDLPHPVDRLRPTKGVHIVYRGEISSSAFLLQSRQDKRVFFVIPFKGNSLIGTTDTDYHESPDHVRVDEADIQYLLQEAGRVFPNIDFDRSKIISTFAGLRPLVADKGDPSRISRKHVVESSSSGIYYVMGGKYTTYRAIAEDAIIKALPHLASKLPYSRQYVLYGSGGSNEELKILSQRFEVPLDLIKYLQSIYGSRFEDVLNITRGNSNLKQKICSCSPAIGAQVIYAREVEMAQTPEDIIERRLGLSYLDCPTGDCRRSIEAIFKSLP